jgi:DamX protein
MSASPTFKLPDYLARYGLRIDPFSADNQQGWFETPALAQRLELIQHLIEFGNQLILVTGEAGSGKSTLLEMILAIANKDWRVCHLQADPSLDRERVLRELCAAFELQHRDVRNPDILEEHLRAHLDSSERSMLLPVAVIDDAHLLPFESLKLLLTLNQPGSGHARLRTLMFCEPMMLSQLAQPQLKAFQENIVHRLDIPAFDAAQTRDFIVDRLQHAGMPSRFRYDDNEFQRIYRASGGLPGHINVLARQALLDGRLEQRRGLQWLALPDWKFPGWKLPNIHWRPWQVFSGLAIVILGMCLWWINSLLDDLLESQPATATLPLELPDPGDIETSEITVPDQPPSEPMAPATEISVSPTPPPQTGTQPPPAKLDLRPPEPFEQAPLEGLLALDAIETDLPIPAAAPQSSTNGSPAEPALAPGAKGYRWFFQQDPEAFVLQLLGAHDPEAINRFLRQHGLGEGIARFYTERDDRRWWVIVYGLYGSQTQAETAIDTLPQALKDLKPFPRSIESILVAMASVDQQGR